MRAPRSSVAGLAARASGDMENPSRAIGGFQPRACAPYRARTKGKGERGVGYVKRNAIAGHELESFAALEALAFLCQREVARKDERRVETASKIAHFPTLRDLDGFDFAAQPPLDRGQIRDLAACRRIAHGDALLLLGPLESDS
jgi:DNA replication protein DnaC